MRMVGRNSSPGLQIKHYIRSGFVVRVVDKAWRIFENDSSHREQTMLYSYTLQNSKEGALPVGHQNHISGRHRCVEIRCRLLGN